MNSRMVWAVSGFVLALMTSSAARAEGVDRAEVDRFAAPLVEREWVAAMVVGVIDGTGGEPKLYGYGRTSDANPKAPDANTVFEIGSITKAFTGTLLADMVGRGEVKLDDPVQKYLPEGVKVPQVGDRPITLVDLATQTSGLPRMPTNMKPADLSNPYADYTPAQLHAFLTTCKPKRKPGEAYEYSNLGMGLLGHVLSLHAGKSYEQVLKERVLKPLAMQDTHFALDAPSRARLASARDADGEPAANWDFDALAPAGAIRSTGADMLKFLAANIDSTKTPLAGAMALAHEPNRLAYPGTEMGLAWHVTRNKTLIWHNGQTAGYHSYCGFVPEKKVGVIVLASSPADVVDALGVSLLKRLLGETTKPPVVRKTTHPAAEALDKCVGRYAITPWFVLDITRDGDRVFCQATAQPRVRIYPESDTVFFYKAVNAQLHFKPGKAGPASAVTLVQNGAKQTGGRVEK